MVVDVGGVFVVPDRQWIATRLSAAGVEFDRDALDHAHYDGIGALDRAAARGEPLGGVYLRGCLDALGVVDGDAAQAGLSALAPGWSRPSSTLWRSPVPGSAEALRRLAASGVALAVVSNSDGSVERLLRSAGICQVGEGPGVSVSAVVDSAVVGVSKPDPEIFAPALASLGVEASEAVYVGDSVHYDVQGATAAGMAAVHFDPYDRCESAEHSHVASLVELVPAASR